MPFSFSLDSFKITNTRSAHKDTDYVVFTLQVGSQLYQPQVKSMGNLNNGTFPVNLFFHDVQVEPADTVVLNYIIVNAGSESAVDAEAALERAGRALASGSSLAPKPPQLTSAMTSQAVLDWLALQLQGIYSPGSCDGLVAAEQDSFTFADLSQRASGAVFSHTTQHVGTESPSNCNKSVSDYSVTWHMALEKTVPAGLIGEAAARAEAAITGAGLTWKLSSGSKTGLVGLVQPPSGSSIDPAIPVVITLDNFR